MDNAIQQHLDSGVADPVGTAYTSSTSIEARKLSQQQRSNDYAPGKQIVIRYDPRRPANSIVV